MAGAPVASAGPGSRGGAAGAAQKDGGGRARRIPGRSARSHVSCLNINTVRDISGCRSRKNKPGAPRQRVQMLTFMSHPETTCSSSHLQARGSAGGAGLLCLETKLAGQLQAPPPSVLPDSAPATEPPLGCPGLAWGPAPGLLGFTPPGAGGRARTPRPRGTTWAPGHAQEGWERPRSPGQGAADLELAPGSLTPRTRSPAAAPTHQPPSCSCKPTTYGLGEGSFDTAMLMPCYFYSSPSLARLHRQGQHFGDTPLVSQFTQ